MTKRIIALIFIFAILPTICFAAMVDLTTFTHTDPNNVIDYTSSRVYWDNISMNESAMHYKSGYTISGDFTHYFTSSFDYGSTDTADDAITTIYGMGDYVGNLYTDYINSTSHHGIFIYLKDSGSDNCLYLFERDGSTGIVLDTQVLNEKYRENLLYYTIDRSSTTITVKIYSDGARKNLLYTLTGTLNSVQSYSTIFVANSHNNSKTLTISGSMGDLYLDETPPKVFNPSISFGTFTEVDSAAHITIISQQQISLSFCKNSTDYLYRDYGSGYFSNSQRRKFLFSANLSSFETYSQGHIFCLSNTLADAYSHRDNDYENITLYWYYDGSAVLWWEDGVGSYLAKSSGASTLTAGTTYYFEIDYDPANNRCTVKIRSNSHSGTLVSSFSISNTSFTPSSYRYLYAAQSYNSGADLTCHGIISNYYTDLESNISILGKTCQSDVVFNGSYHTLVYLPYAGSAPKAKIAYPSDHIFGSDISLNSDSTLSMRAAYEFSLNYFYKANPISFMFISDGLGCRMTKNDSTDIFYSFADDASAYADDITLSNDITGVSVGSSSVAGFAYERHGRVYARRSSGSYMGSYNITNTMLDEVLLKTLSGEASWTQVVYWWYPNTTNRAGIFYTDLDSTNKLYYRDADYYLTTFQAEQTVSSDLYSLSCYRCVHTQNNKHFVFYRSATDNKIYYSTRTYGTSSAWSTPTIVNDDTAYDGDGYFTVVADHGHQEYINIHYYNGTNIVSRTWNGSTWGSSSTLFSSPTLADGDFQAPYETSFEYMVVVNTSTGIDYEAVTLSPSEFVNSGKLFSYYGSPNSMNQQNGLYAKACNGKVFIGATSVGGQSIENILDVSSETFDFSNTNMSDYSYLDSSHNAIVRFVDNDGYAYISEGGREYPGNFTDIPVKVYKSNYTIDNASFALNKSSGWTNISPSECYGRGYKAIVVDDDNVVYLIYSDSSDSPAGSFSYKYGIREYRSGSWSSYLNIVTFNDGPQSYLHSCCLGKEASGQKSLHLVYGWRDNDFTDYTYGGGLGLNEFYYVNLVPNGSGGFSAYDSSGSRLSLPLDNLDGDVVYIQADNYPTSNTLVPSNIGQIDLLDADTPVIATAMYTPGNGDPLVDSYSPGYYAFVSDGAGNWARKTVADTSDGVPTLGWQNGLARFSHTSTGVNFYVGTIDNDDGTDQISMSISTDGCSTFSTPESITSGDYVCHSPYLAPITSSTSILMWVVDVSHSHSEIRYEIVYLGLEATDIRALGCTLNFTSCTVMSADHLYLYRDTSSDINPSIATPINSGSPISGSTVEYIDRSGSPGVTYYYLAVYYDSGDSEILRTSEIDLTTIDASPMILHHHKIRRYR